jgi:hypothetical protein
MKIGTGKASEGGHWYGRDGSCVYEVEAKKGGMRPATLRDARKLGLVPGFSAIAQMEHKAQLVNWLVQQAYLACLTLPRVEGETLEEFKARAEADAAEQATAARDRGTQIHTALESYFEGWPVNDEDKPFVMPVVEYLNQRFPDAQWQAENSFAHPYGYGGKCDLRADGIIIDFKTKAFDDPEKTLAYPEHEMQLHAYEFGFGMPPGLKVNIFVSTSKPGLFVVHEWPHNPESLEAFRCLLRLWQIRKGYDSSFAVTK